MQNDLERPSSQDLPPPPPPSPLPHPHSLPLLEKHLPIVTNSNGRSDLLGRTLGQGLGPGQGSSGQGITSGQCRGLGAGDCGPGVGVGAGRNPLVQELSELEGQILVIKQQLQSAMRRKRELEQYQSENQQAKQTAPSQPTTHQSNQFAQYTQSHQQTNQHTNTLPEFWRFSLCPAWRNLAEGRGPLGPGEGSLFELWSLNIQRFLGAESSVRLRGSPERWTERFSRDPILLCDSSRTIPDSWNMGITQKWGDGQRWTRDPELNLFSLACFRHWRAVQTFLFLTSLPPTSSPPCHLFLILWFLSIEFHSFSFQALPLDPLILYL